MAVLCVAKGTMMAMHRTPVRRTEPPAEDRGWAETRAFYPLDVRLRNAGFRIVSRPRKGPDTWVRSRVIFTVDQARAIVDEDDAARGVER